MQNIKLLVTDILQLTGNHLYRWEPISPQHGATYITYMDQGVPEDWKNILACWVSSCHLFGKLCSHHGEISLT